MGATISTGTSSGIDRATKVCRMPMPAPERTASAWPSAEERAESGNNAAGSATPTAVAGRRVAGAVARCPGQAIGLGIAARGEQAERVVDQLSRHQPAFGRAFHGD